MSKRAEKKAAAAAARAALKISWADMAKAQVVIGGTAKEALTLVEKDALAIIRREPSRKSEIERAIIEFGDALAATAKAIVAKEALES